MHILTLTPFYPSAENDAAGCFVSGPLQALQELGNTMTVLAVQPFYAGTQHRSETAPATEWVRYLTLPSGLGLSSAGLFLFARLLPKLRRLHKAKPIDLVHAHAALPCGHAAALLSRELGIPFVVTVHGLDALYTNQVKGRTGEWCRRVSQHVYRSAKRVICISERVREQVLLGCREVQTATLYNGVDISLFFPATPEAEQPMVLSVGNLIPIKGHEALLRAIASLLPARPDISCEIIGDGLERARLENLAHELNIAGNVHFLGRKSRAEVAEAMRRCTLFALPSRYEGLGCVYLEAMACGKPVVGCREQGIEEVVHHGRNGLLVGPDNVRELTEAMSLLIRDRELRARLGIAARNTIVNGYTMQHQADQLSSTYQECVG